jgi:hypothetical protein
MSIIPSILKAKFEIPDEDIAKLDQLDKQMHEQFEKIINQGVKLVV